MKKKTSILVGLIFLNCIISGQKISYVSELKWQEGSDILVTMENDSGYILDLNELFHSEKNISGNDFETYVYYPVMLAESFINQLKEKNITVDTTVFNETDQGIKYRTLWSGVNSTLGGGWVHFINCMLYSLESGQLNLTAPLLKRPQYNWKPQPITESYKRTNKWEYFLPVNQKQAIKEYNLKKKEGSLGDIYHIPQAYVQLFLETTEKEYEKLKIRNDYKTLAKIDLVRLLLGSNYLGIPQIHYIKSMVLKAVLQYSIKNPVPTIIIFDDIEAAVAMKLDDYGYHIEKVAFKNEELLSETEYETKLKLLNTIVSGINEVNNRLFELKLREHYQ